MAVELESEFNINSLWPIIKRRFLLILAVFIIGCFATVYFAFKTVPVYRSEGLIGIQSSRISKEFVGSSVGQLNAIKYVDEHIDKVNRYILSHENLSRINKKYSLYPNAEKPGDLAMLIGQNLDIESVTRSVDGTSWAQKITIGFSMAFEYSDPEKTYDVINDIIKSVLDKNVKDRTERAAETTKFLTEELNSLKSQLEIVEDKVAEFKQQNADSLPEHQAMHMNSLDQLRGRLQDLEIENKSTKEELRYLDVELATANENASRNLTPVVGAQNVFVSELQKAREELNNAMAAYKDTHPTVKSLKRKVALLEKTEKAPKKTNQESSTNPAANLAIAKIQSQIESAKVRLDSIAQEKRNLRAQIARVNRHVLKIPQVEQQLVKLLRDYDNAKLKYEDVKAKQVNARIAEDLEKNNQSERFTLLKSPDFPEYRTNMGITKMIILGFLGSIGLGLGTGVLLEFLDKRIRSQATLTALIGEKPIAIVPYIDTQEEIANKTRLIKRLITFFILILCIIACAVLVHMLITPLDGYVIEFKESFKALVR